MQTVLSDYNCIGQAETIFRVLRIQGYTSFADIELIHFRDIGLDPSTDDEIIWQLCQTKGYLLDLENLRGTPRLFIPGQALTR